MCRANFAFDIQEGRHPADALKDYDLRSTVPLRDAGIDSTALLFSDDSWCFLLPDRSGYQVGVGLDRLREAILAINPDARAQAGAAAAARGEA